MEPEGPTQNTIRIQQNHYDPSNELMKKKFCSGNQQLNFIFSRVSMSDEVDSSLASLNLSKENHYINYNKQQQQTIYENPGIKRSDIEYNYNYTPIQAPILYNNLERPKTPQNYRESYQLQNNNRTPTHSDNDKKGRSHSPYRLNINNAKYQKINDAETQTFRNIRGNFEYKKT